MPNKKDTSVKKAPVPGYSYVQTVDGVQEYKLKINGLRVLFQNRPGTGVITSNITYLVGARDEERGVTGIAHMLEHMLFKPTKFDIKAKIDSGAMQFERETGCALNANTWKDRTTYYFSYPAEHLNRALQIEAERMNDVVLTDESLSPERNNVLSEFDMNNGDPHFALAVQMVSVAYQSHPYGHETIGYREDIEDYTAEKLEVFYRNYYRPDNAVMMVIGDTDVETALKAVKDKFGRIENPKTPVPRFTIRESKQEGIRRVEVVRPSNTNIVSIGFRHAGFPTNDWFITDIMLDALTGGPESILHKLLIDTSKAAQVSGSIEPSSEENLGSINITLAKGQNHAEIESLVLKAINELSAKDIDSLIKKTKAKMLTSELFTRTHSLKIAAELTEYVASGKWETYAKTPEILKNITTKQVIAMQKKTFTSNNLTIGYFVGKQ